MRVLTSNCPPIASENPKIKWISVSAPTNRVRLEREETWAGVVREPRRGLWSWSATKQLTFMLEARWEDRGIGSSGIVRDTFAREVYEPATSSFKRTTFTGPVYVHVVQLAFSLAPRPPFSPGEKRTATCGNRNRGAAIKSIRHWGLQLNPFSRQFAF